MMRNIHERCLAADPGLAADLIDLLGSERDRLWPRERWPAMKFDRPLAVGAIGGHGPIGYAIECYEPGSRVRFRFSRPRGFAGLHWFELEEAGSGSVPIRHVIETELSGAARFTWPIAIRWLHDSLLEDAFDRAEAYLRGTRWQPRHLGIWVRTLRSLMAAKQRRPAVTS